MQKVLISLILCCSSIHIIASESEEWRFSATPYLWLADQSGTVATLPNSAPIEIDIPISDILSNMDMALMGLFEAKKGKFGFFGEIFYVGVSPEATLPGSLYSEINYEQDLTSISAGVLYTLSQSANYHIDIVAGARFWDLDNELILQEDLLPTVAIAKQESWNDIFIGLKARMLFAKNWAVSGWIASVVTGDSDSSFDAFAGIEYQYDSFALNVGYRHLEVDYNKSDFLFDVTLSGPIVGFILRY